MIKLSMEIPTSMLAHISPLCDMDFCLAQVAMTDDEYSTFYLRRPHVKRIMDNGFHEKQHPLEPVELLEAAERVNPTYVISPDKIGNASYTWRKLQEMQHVFNSKPYQIACVLQWSDPSHLNMLFQDLRRTNIQLLCLPYRLARWDAFCDLLGSFGRKQRDWPAAGRIHLLGMNTARELEMFRQLWQTLDWDPETLSFDTAKPIKWGLAGQLLEDLPNPHGGGLVDHDAPFPDTFALNRIHRNIAYLRKYL